MTETQIRAARPIPADEAQQAREADLNTELYRAYLSGDGAAVERVMARMAAQRRESTAAA